MQFPEAHPVLPYAPDGSNISAISLAETDLNEVETLLHALATPYAIGGYAEDRAFYRRSANFANSEGDYRSVHLGLDLWAPAGTAVFAPLEGTIHSYSDNAHEGDYGPTILISHAGVCTLYGHLDRASLAGLAVGQLIRAGQQIGRLGPAFENGNWPPHLHFQLILDPGSWRGDYPGVAFRKDSAWWLKNSPDPNLLLRLPIL